MEKIITMNVSRHKNTLLRNLGEDAVTLLKTTKAIIAGGAITSIFTGTEINDYDIYFRTKKDIVTFIRNAFYEEGDEESDEFPLSEEDFLDIGRYEFVCVNSTDRSISFSHNGLNLQLIHFDYFIDAKEIFKSYDFHINMAAYDFGIDDFVFDEQFIIDIASRRLTFNAGTRYPIMSSLRISKYIERGYSISIKEMFKIGLAISDLNVDSWDKLEDQLSGFYGVDVSEMFDRSKPFDMETAIRMIDEVYDIPRGRNNSPTFEMLMFAILGNPYEGKRIFFKGIIRRNDGRLTHSFGDTEYAVQGSKYYKDGLQVETLYGDVVQHRYSPNGSPLVGVFFLEDGGKMKMGYDGLKLVGNVRLIAVKEF